MPNAGSAMATLPSLTLTTMFENAPAALGVPDNLPVDVLKLAQAGLF
jgi:hypothetical protein